MRKYEPPKRLVELGKVLQYDTGLQELGLSPILTTEQRILINQERGRIMSGDFDYIQPVNGKTKGLHLFRYTLTHRLLSAKVPHQVVTDILGHTSKESDKPYISLEESMLRMCALDLSEIGKIHWGEDKFE